MTGIRDKFDLIIFDWDGTLVDSIDWIVHCLQTAAITQGLKAPDEQSTKNTIGLCIQNAMSTLFPGISHETQELLSKAYSTVFFSQELNKQHLFIGIEEMLTTLKNNSYQVAIATGKTRTGLDWAINRTELTNFFDITRTADESASKPHPLMLEQIIEETRIDKKRVLMVGDSVHDLQMANNAGIEVIAVSCGANTKVELQQFNPLLNLNKTTDLLNYL